MSSAEEGEVQGWLRKKLGRSWKTTIAGIIVGLTSAAKIGHTLATGDMTLGEALADAPMLLAAFGLGFAKDHNASHTEASTPKIHLVEPPKG